MNKDPLVAYIEKEIQKGFSEELIQEKLEKAEYTKDEIVHAFSSYHRHGHYRKVIGHVVDKEAEKRWAVVVLALFVVVLFVVLVFLAVQYIDLASFESEEVVRIDPQEESDCSIFSHRDKERCLLKVAAYQDSTTFCVNMTSKVMKYQCTGAVWNTNYCNYLILTNRSVADCY
jgi:hypothetical protein